MLDGMAITSPAQIRSAQPRRFAVDWRVRLGGLALIWGTSFLFIKVSLEALQPVQVALGRCALGAAALYAVTRVTHSRLPRDAATWLHLAVVAGFLNAIPFALFGYAEQRIPSSLAGVANSTTPLATVLFAMAVLPQERPTRRRIAGLLVGFAGVLVMLGFWRGVGGDLTGGLLAVIASASYGVGFGYVRRFLVDSGRSAIALTAGQLIAATVELAGIAVLTSATPNALPVRVVLAVAALGIFGTGIAYALQFGIIRVAGSTAASTVTYLVPVVAVALGLLAGERPIWNEPVGAVVIGLGAALVGTGRRATRNRTSRRTMRPVADDRCRAQYFGLHSSERLSRPVSDADGCKPGPADAARFGSPPS